MSELQDAPLCADSCCAVGAVADDAYCVKS